MFQTEDLTKIISKKLQIEFGESLTDKQINGIINKYWLNVLYSLNNVTSASIILNFLGTFSSRYGLLKLEIRRLIEKLRAMEEGALKDFYKKRLSNMWKVKQTFDKKNTKIKLKNERRNKSIDECKEEL